MSLLNARLPVIVAPPAVRILTVSLSPSDDSNVSTPLSSLKLYVMPSPDTSMLSTSAWSASCTQLPACA